MRLLTALILALSVTAVARAADSSPASIQDLRSMHSLAGTSSELDAKKAAAENIRIIAMRDAAMALGAQHGFAARMAELKHQIAQQSDELDAIFDFKTMMTLAHGGRENRYLLPPVLREVNNLFTVSDDANQIRISGKLYQIEQPERLVSEPPNWRAYLVIDEDIAIPTPSDLVLPKNDDEQKVWSALIDNGWRAGTAQAEEEMLSRVRKLGSEYNGMLRYIMLATEGKVKKSEVAYSKLNVVGSGNEMRENEMVYQVTKPAELNSNVNDWIPLNLDTRGSLRRDAELK